MGQLFRGRNAGASLKLDEVKRALVRFTLLFPGRNAGHH